MVSLETYADEKLVRLLKSNNTAAFDQLYIRYVPRLEAFLRIYTKDEFLREEVIQEVFVKVWQKRHQLDESLSFKGLLFQMVKFQIFNVFRKKVNQIDLEQVQLNASNCANNTEQYIDYLDLQHNLSGIISQLPEMQQKVFTLSRMEGLSNDEIACQLNLSKRTVEHHVYLALKFIKKNFSTMEIGCVIACLLVSY